MVARCEDLPEEIDALRAALMAERARAARVEAELAVARAKASDDAAVIGAVSAAGRVILAAWLVLRLRHKFQKSSNDAAFERLRDWLFLPEIAAFAGGGLVCDAVVLRR